MALKKFAFDATILTVARICQAAANALALPLLARLLQPSDFGLMAAANSILFLATVLADSGFANSLVRTDFSDYKVWSSVFWVTAAWSGCLGLLVAALAVPVSWILKQPNASPLIAALAILPFGIGLLAAPAAELQQRKKFLWIGVSDILAAFSGISAAVFFAAKGAGPWALVAQSLTALGVKAAVVLSATRFRPRLIFNRHLISEHLHFARNTAAFAIVLFFGTQMDNIMISRSVGPGPLGLYSMSYRLMGLPQLLGSGNNALYPRLVKLHQDKQALRQLVLIVTTILSIVIFPPMALICASGQSVFTVLLSDRWSEVADLFVFMAPVGALQAVTGIHVILLMAIDRTDIRLKITIESCIIWLIVLLSVAHLGVRAVAMGLMFSYLIYYPRLLYLILRPIDCTVLDYFRAMSVPLVISIAFALGHAFLRQSSHFDPLSETFVAAVEAVLAYLTIALFLLRSLRRALITAHSLIKRADDEA